MTRGESITADMVRPLLQYDPETGVFRWRARRCGRALEGAIAGTFHGRGYRHIKVCGKRLSEHRLAFLLMTGAWPQHDVDHINGEPADNRWRNLRDVPAALNMQNQRHAQKSKRTGHLLGAHWHKRIGKWQATITVVRKKLHIGYFATEYEAHEAYVQAKRRVHPAGML